MNNKDNYKNALNQIKASDELKTKTIEQIKAHKKSKKIVYMKYLSACAVFLLIFCTGLMYLDEDEIIEEKIPEEKITSTIALNKNLPRFESLEELTNLLSENTKGLTNGTRQGDVFLESATDEMKLADTAVTNQKEDLNYSKTNVQVENVDEADIVKTDGKYIYYVTNNEVFIIEATDLKMVSKITVYESKEYFSPHELFVNGNKLIVIGNYFTFKEITNSAENEEGKFREYTSRVRESIMAEAIVYDITDKVNPKEVRTVKLDGYYSDSRMIGENIYLISSKNPMYYDGCKAEEILPKINDSLTGEKLIEATDIAYFRGTDSTAIMTVAGFDINNNNGVCSETFFGASENVYASKDHLFLTQTNYEGGSWYNSNGITIYKFKLNNGKIELLCKGEVKGYINNQFSMDEYDGKLRIATTYGHGDEATNQLYVLDEDLKEIAKIEDMAKGERIYSVRFIGKVGYIVTFKQVDPLFVIDLSDPYNPTIKGELKIPGYSSYLHPYDETHIIGIGYNTKSNGHGGVTNSSMKMSMFDISDLSNPTEMFSVNIGDSYAYSEVLYNHKVLFENKAKGLIGFPASIREYSSSRDRDTFIVFHIDLEKGFKKHGEISQKIDYRTNIDRAIYIGNTLYTLSETVIKAYNLETFEEIKALELDLTNHQDTTTAVKETMIVE